MTKPLVIDIETLPLEASLAAPYPRDDFSPPANYKNPDVIDRWHTDNETNWRRRRGKECSLNPRLGRVLCFSTQFGVTYAMQESDERSLLDMFWRQVFECGGNIVTWNGIGFDARFLVIRSLAHGVTPSVPDATVRSWFRKYSYDTHFDVRAAVLNWAGPVAGEGLDEWAAFFGLELKPGVDGSDIAFLYEQGDHERIVEYCDHDRKVTGQMYEKLAPYFGGRQ